MLSTSAEPASSQFTRRDAGRLRRRLAPSLALAMSVILGLDILPAQQQLEVGKPRPGQRRRAAHRRVHERRPHGARPRGGRAGRRRPAVRLHDRAGRRGRRPAGPRARAQGRADRRRVRRRRERRGPRGAPRRRARRRAGRATTARRCSALDAARWQAVRTEAARVLDTVERSELRDSEVALTRDGVENRFAGDLTEAETALGAALIRPLVVANSSFSRS